MELPAPTARAATVKTEVTARYLNPRPAHDPFLEWIVRDHLYVVLAEVQRLAEKYGANQEYCYVAALLHDVADPWYSRDKHDNHDELSRALATEVLQIAQFSPEEIRLIVGDVIRFHGCRGEERPQSLEGKCLATADALAHFQSGLYFYASRVFNQKPFSTVVSWMRGKLERDFSNKIFWDAERDLVRPIYTTLKSLIARW